MITRRRVGAIHVHSDYSRDGRDSLERIRQFALERRIGFVALTDHAEDVGPDRFDRYLHHCQAVSDSRVIIIPGLEYRFDGFPGMHLLALGLTRWIDPRTPNDFATQARDVAKLTIAAHPVLAGYRLAETVSHTIDAVEIWNASYNTRYLPDPRAIRLLHLLRRMRPEVVGTAGLDQHDAANDRATRVVVDVVESDPLAAVKAGRFVNIGRTMRLGPTVDWGPLRLGLLTLARFALDRIDRAHERLARAGPTRALARESR